MSIVPNIDFYEISYNRGLYIHGGVRAHFVYVTLKIQQT